MQRFQFRLDPLLRLKRQQLHQAELQLSIARTLYEACAKRKRELRDQLDQAADEIGRRDDRPDGGNRLLETRRWIEMLRAQIAVADENLAKAEANVQRAAEGRRQIATEVQGLETVRAEQWRQYKKDWQDYRQHELDEFILRGWQAAT